MTQTLDNLSVDHDFAPGVEPSAFDRLLNDLSGMLLTPEVALIAVGLVGAAALFILVGSQTRRRRPKVRSRPPEAAKSGVDLAALRHSRMPDSSGDARDDAAA